LGAHSHARGGTQEYAHSNFMGPLAVGDYLSTNCSGGSFGTAHNHSYNGGFYIWRLR